MAAEGAFASSQVDAIYCEATCDDEPYYEGSEDDDYPDPQTRRLRYEAAGQRYLDGQVPLLLSASLRGPFDTASGWTNPWRSKQRRQARVISQCVPESPQIASIRDLAPPAGLTSTILGPEGHLPSPESLKHVPTIAPNPYLQDDTLETVEHWRQGVEAPSPPNPGPTSPEADVKASTKKRRAPESSWLRRLPSKKKRLDGDLATSSQTHPNWSQVESCSSPTSKVHNGLLGKAPTPNRGSFHGADDLPASEMERTMSCRDENRQDDGLRNDKTDAMMSSSYPVMSSPPSTPHGEMLLPHIDGRRQSLFTSNVTSVPVSALQLCGTRDETCTMDVTSPSQIRQPVSDIEHPPLQTQHDQSFSFKMRRDRSMADAKRLAEQASAALGMNSLETSQASEQDTVSESRQSDGCADSPSRQEGTIEPSAHRLSEDEVQYSGQLRDSAAHFSDGRVFDSSCSLPDSLSSPADQDSAMLVQRLPSGPESILPPVEASKHGRGSSTSMPAAVPRQSTQNSGFAPSAKPPPESPRCNPASSPHGSESSKFAESPREISDTTPMDVTDATVNNGVADQGVRSSPSQANHASIGPHSQKCTKDTSSVHEIVTRNSLTDTSGRDAPSSENLHQASRENVVDPRMAMAAILNEAVCSSSPGMKPRSTGSGELQSQDGDRVMDDVGTAKLEAMEKPIVSSAQTSAPREEDMMQVEPDSLTQAGTPKSLCPQSPMKTNEDHESQTRLPVELQSPWIRHADEFADVSNKKQPDSSHSPRVNDIASSAHPDHNSTTSQPQLPPETPKPQFVCRSFASFLSPLSKRDRRQSGFSQRTRDLSGLASAMKKPRSGRRIERHVSWAPVPQGTGNNGGGGDDSPHWSQERLLRSSSTAQSSKPRQSSPPPPAVTLADVHSMERFNTHFAAVTGRKTPSVRRKLIPTDSQQSFQSPGLHGMAKTFLAADEAAHEASEGPHATASPPRSPTRETRAPEADHDEDESEGAPEDLFADVADIIDAWNAEADLVETPSMDDRAAASYGSTPLQSPWSKF